MTAPEDESGRRPDRADDRPSCPSPRRRAGASAQRRRRGLRRPLADDGPPVAGGGGVSVSGGRAVRIGDRVFAGLASRRRRLHHRAGRAGRDLPAHARPCPRSSDDKANFLTLAHWLVGGTQRYELRHRRPAVDHGRRLADRDDRSRCRSRSASRCSSRSTRPKRMSKPVAYVIDLLAAIPSIIYGIWGIAVLAPKLDRRPARAVPPRLHPALHRQGRLGTGTIFDGGDRAGDHDPADHHAISRDVFERTPRHNIEAAWALGATRWEMIRLAVLPFGRPGVISGAMLGLGRALGETIAMLPDPVAAPATARRSPRRSSAAARRSRPRSPTTRPSSVRPKSTGAYIAAGLVLFVLTFIVNAAARAIVNRRKEFIE